MKDLVWDKILSVGVDEIDDCGINERDRVHAFAADSAGVEKINERRSVLGPGLRQAVRE